MTTKEAKMGHRERLQIVTVKTKKRRRKNVHSCEDVSSMAHIRADEKTKRTREGIREGGSSRATVGRKREGDESAMEIGGEEEEGVRRRVGGVEDVAVKELEGEKENARDHRRDDGEYGNNNINNNGKEADERTERLNKRRERLREALMKQKVRLLEEIEREENRERIRARFGS